MTKKQRNEFYKKLLKIFCKDSCLLCGLCHFIKHRVSGIHLNVYDISIFKNELPELYAQKPRKLIIVHGVKFWYDRTAEGWGKRVAAIKRAIELTEI